MHTLVRIFVVLPAILFFVVGIRWLVDPASVAAEFGMPLLDGLGRSTQIGDLAAFFMSASLMIFLGLITHNRTWFLAPAMLIGLTAVFRILAWLTQGASLATEQIAVEVIVTVILLIAAATLPAKSSQS